MEVGHKASSGALSQLTEGGNALHRLTHSIRIFLLHKHKCNRLPVALLRRARVRAAVQHAQALGLGVYPAGVQHRREAAAAQPFKPLTNEQHLLG